MSRAALEQEAKRRNSIDARTRADNVMSLEQFKNGQRAPKRKGNREHSLQVACVRWFRAQYPNLRKHLLSIPNGAKLANGAKAWKRLEAEGAVAGAPDLLLLVPSGDYGFLCIEMKTPKGRQQQSQKAFEDAIVSKGGAYCIPRSLDQFQNLVRSYLERGEF